MTSKETSVNLLIEKVFSIGEEDYWSLKGFAWGEGNWRIEDGANIFFVTKYASEHGLCVAWCLAGNRPVQVEGKETPLIFFEIDADFNCRLLFAVKRLKR